MRFIGSSDFNIKTIRTFGLKAYTCTSIRRSIYIVKVIEGITSFRLSPYKVKLKEFEVLLNYIFVQCL